jgi:hypothetical protein
VSRDRGRSYFVEWLGPGQVYWHERTGSCLICPSHFHCPGGHFVLAKDMPKCEWTKEPTVACECVNCSAS